MKRVFDMVAALLALIVLSPVLVAVACLIALRIGRPVLFRQQRPGREGQSFTICKFRTMTNAVGEDGELLPDEKRLLPLGLFLRKTSLDELPELLNVLRGDMSLVGPRPLLLEYLSLYTAQQYRRNEVRPGLTGWAQVNGRNALSWEEKFRLDVWYVDNRGFWLDIKILFLTVLHVVKRDGISHDGEATMPRFVGSKETRR